jgi:Curli production assembly/transport component CsgG
MKTLTILFFATLLPFAEQQAPAAEAPVTVAVFNFQTAGEKLANKGSEAALLLGTQLSTAPDLMLVERQELEKALGEQELGLSGTISPETAAKVGALTGAKVLITGRVFEAGAKNYLVVKIIGTETSRVFGEAATFNDPGTLDKAVAEIAPKVAAIIGARADALVAKVEDPAARLARLKAAIGGRKLPSVTISVTEQHLNRPVIDPAVETEFKLTLQQLGFEIVDPKSSAKSADLSVIGEAFSEAAGRRGNLISCRARVELKAVRNADGKLLLTDRQTDVGVDLAENIAAKSALENAARKLIDRLVPKVSEP